MTAKVLNTVRQHSEKNPAFPQGSIRNLIFNAKTNGFDACLVRLGRKVLIDEAEFFNWIDRQNGKAGLENKAEVGTCKKRFQTRPSGQPLEGDSNG